MKNGTRDSVKIMLSPSALNLFKECASCFWFEKVKNIRRPRGIFPSLPSGMDRVIKTYFDVYRKRGVLPPELQVDAFSGIKLFEDQAKLDGWRDWRSGLQYCEEGGAVCVGAIDDLLVKDGQYIPFDYKTKGSPTTPEDSAKYYQNQLDCYALLMHENKLPVAGYAFLIYFSPKSVSEKGSVQFNLQAIRLDIDVERARQTFRRAVDFLRGPMPEPGFCEYCTWMKKLNARNGLQGAQPTPPPGQEGTFH